MAVLINYLYYAELLDRSLCKMKTNDKASILQQHLFVASTLSEIIALVWRLSILHVSICMPVPSLADKTHELEKHSQWGPMSMAHVLDTLEASMKIIAANPGKNA